MSYLEDGYFKVAATNSPLFQPDLDGYSNLQSIDSVLYWITEYFTNVLRIHLTPRWNSIVSSIGRDDLLNRVVNETLPYDPLPFANDNQFRFPLLCAYRTKEDYLRKTANWYNINSVIEIVYMMPPLASEQLEQMHPFLTQVSRILLDRTINGLDSNYLNGLDVWKQSGLEEIGCSSSNYGKVPGFENGIYFPSIILQIECKERNMPVSPYSLNYPPYTGADIRVESTDDSEVSDDNFKVEFETGEIE